MLVPPAAAQVGASISIYSEERARGEATSGGRPVAALDLSYDARDGFYMGGSASVVATTRSGLQLLDTTIFAGFAHRLEAGPTIEAGVSDTRYSEYGGFRRAAGYSEAYVGVLTQHFSARLHYSPGYYRKDVSTAYGELDGVLDPTARWRFSGHFGALVRLSGADRAAMVNYDWRVNVQRSLGWFDLHVALTGGGPGPDPYRPGISRRPALIVGLSRTL